MKIPWKRIGIAVVCVAMAYGVYVGFHVVRRFRLFLAEDTIMSTYYPLVNAIHQYAEDNGGPPGQLSDLIPESIPAIPTYSIVHDLRYRVGTDGSTWRLELDSSAHGKERTYCRQSDRRYTEEDGKRIVGTVHGDWMIMRAR